jgi:biotin transport system substrate-specific component
MRDADQPTLAAALWPGERATRLARGAALVVGGAMLLAISAKIQLPFYPVPMTLQTLVVLLLALALGARLAGGAVALYLAEGLVGLPVFAGVVAGPQYLAGPTGGFLVGFLVAALAVGALAERGWDRTARRLVAAAVLGHLIIFATGYAWLAALIGPEEAWLLGVAPFYLATVLKTLLAVALMLASWRGADALRGRQG